MQSDLSHEILVKFDIEKLLDRKINEISGGEKQRVYLASVMSQSADIFLLDEPLNNLDLFWQNKFLEIADQLSKTKLFFTISHDLNVVQCFAKNILVFDEMKFQMYKKNELMNSELLERIFKVKFIKVENKFMITYV